jgi:hypothetical protein
VPLLELGLEERTADRQQRTGGLAKGYADYSSAHRRSDEDAINTARLIRLLTRMARTFDNRQARSARCPLNRRDRLKLPEGARIAAGGCWMRSRSGPQNPWTCKLKRRASAAAHGVRPRGTA